MVCFFFDNPYNAIFYCKEYHFFIKEAERFVKNEFGNDCRAGKTNSLTLAVLKDYINFTWGEILENQIIFNQFEELEQKVESLIKACKSYGAANLELKNKIERLEEELQGKVEAENSYRRERDLIRSKIDNLLSKITDITED